MHDADFVRLRTQLNELHFRQPLGVDSAPLAAALLADLIKTTSAYRDLQNQMEAQAAEAVLHKNLLVPVRKENSRLLRENNALHLELVGRAELHSTELRAMRDEVRALRTRADETALVNTQLQVRMRELEARLHRQREQIAELTAVPVAVSLGRPRELRMSSPLPGARARAGVDSGSAGAASSAVDAEESARAMRAMQERNEVLQAQLDAVLMTNVALETSAAAGARTTELLRAEVNRLHGVLRSELADPDRAGADATAPLAALRHLSQTNARVIDQLSAQIDMLQSQLSAVAPVDKTPRKGKARGPRAASEPARSARPESRTQQLERENALLRRTCDEVLARNRLLCEELALVETAHDRTALGSHALHPLSAAEAMASLQAKGYLGGKRHVGVSNLF